MAAGLAITLANGVIKKLGEIPAQQEMNEAPLLRNFKSDFKWFEGKLGQIRASLQAADEQNAQNASVKKWLAEVRNIVFDAEDIIDECAVEHLYTNTSNQSCVPNCSPFVFRYKIVNRIKELKERINSTIQKARELKLERGAQSEASTSTSGNEREAEWRRWGILDKDPPALGIDHKVNEILRLMDNPAVGVVAVIGMGGLGKTFLLQHVYNRNKQRYEHSAWISVSRTCYLRKLQCDLASQIGLQLENGITDRLLPQSIHGKLEGKRCLIVLDDVWSSSVEGNLISGLGLPTGHNDKCKIVVTTRSRDVVENINAHVYEMQHLSMQDSWDLFCLYAFPDRGPPEMLENLSHQIVEECGRLPLAIKIVAASMAKSSLKLDWESKLEQLKYVGRAEDTIMKILKLSFDSLPSHLQSCFAYFSLFAEGTQIYFSRIESTQGIHQDYLIYLWIVEGFIPQEQGKDERDIGFNYLHQLINLCLVEVNTVSICYTVHDLLHDLVVSICKEHEFKFELPFRETSCRRLLLAKKGLDSNVISERPLFCQRFLRTLSFSQNPGIVSIPQHLFDRVRVLRLLDFSSTAISSLPESVGKLKLLKVLNLSHTMIREVPECVRRFRCLEILDVSRCKSLQRVPDWIGELKCLSYLDVEWCSAELRRSRMPKGMSQLSSLRTLKSLCFSLDAKGNDFLNVKDVGKLINLREIRFRLEDENALISVQRGVLDGLAKMRILVVQNSIRAKEGDTGESSLPAFPEKLKVMKDLEKLFLARFSVPHWICGLENLTLLSLANCSDYEWLGRIPNLQLLLLEDDSRCRELPKNFGERGGFPNLVSLQIEDFPVLEELPALEKGAMQCLEGLSIVNCPRMKKVPEGLEQLKTLKRILIGQKSGELKDRLMEGGEDWKKMKASNDSIYINFID